MKLLFDENLSHRLVARLADVFPGSVHVRLVGLERAPDADVWAYARAHGLTIVTQDSDFNDRSMVLGAPPRVVWLHAGNLSTRQAEALLRASRERVEALGRARETTVLILP